MTATGYFFYRFAWHPSVYGGRRLPRQIGLYASTTAVGENNPLVCFECVLDVCFERNDRRVLSDRGSPAVMRRTGLRCTSDGIGRPSRPRSLFRGRAPSSSSGAGTNRKRGHWGGGATLQYLIFSRKSRDCND